MATPNRLPFADDFAAPLEEHHAELAALARGGYRQHGRDVVVWQFTATPAASRYVCRALLSGLALDDRLGAELV